MDASQLERLIEVGLFTNLFHHDYPQISGWWADAPTGNALGSHLFTFSREKITGEALRSINRATASALEWLTTNQHVESVKTSSKRLKNGVEISVLIDGHTFNKFLPVR